MRTKRFLFIRWFLILVFVLPALACNLSETPIADTLQPESVPPAASSGGETATEEPPVAAPEPTVTSTPTEAPVTMTAGQTLSCVQGPHWALYDWVTSIADGETVTLLARNEPGDDPYYYARKSDGKECWAFGGSSTLTGDPSTLPIMEAPPLPVVTYTVQNRIHYSLCNLFLREHGESDWGPDRFAAAFAFNSESSLSLTAGFYDVRIIACMAGTVYERDNTPIGADPGSRIITIDNVVHLNLHNSLSGSFCRVRLAPNDGSDLIFLREASDAPVPPGESTPVTVPVGVYSVTLFNCTFDTAMAAYTNQHIDPSMEGATLY
jgi:hypothetical protein